MPCEQQEGRGVPLALIVLTDGELTEKRDGQRIGLVALLRLGQEGAFDLRGAQGDIANDPARGGRIVRTVVLRLGALPARRRPNDAAVGWNARRQTVDGAAMSQPWPGRPGEVVGSASDPSSRWFRAGRAFFTSRTPFRLSFFGGGTDYPQWYRSEGGAVLSTTIDKYCYISGRWLPPFFSYSHRIVWSHIETVSSIAEIMHPAVRQGLRMLNFTDAEGVELHHQADLPARTGIGSSSAFAVGLIRVLTALRRSTPDEDLPDRETLYLKAIALEQEWIKDAVGSQDQVATAVGGLNVIRFAPDGRITVTPLGISPDRQAALEARLLLVYTGLSRAGPELARQIIDNLGHRTATLRRMQVLVDQAAALLASEDTLDGFGDMLDETWALKRNLSDQVSNDRIDAIYAAARQAGARGGKLLGAGSSGFIVLYVPPERQDAVRQALATLLEVPFRFETQGSVLMDGHWA